MLTSLASTLGPYLPALISLVVLPLVGALLNWALWWDTPAHWDAFAAKYPGRARVIRVLRAVFPHLRKALAAWRDAQTAKGQSGSVDVATLAFAGAVGAVLLSGAVLVGCPAQVPPTDSGAASWQPAAIISLSIASAAVQEAEATESLTGLDPAGLATYDAALHLAGDGIAAALDHVVHGASPCTLHADAARAADGFDRVAAILSAQGKPTPSSVLTGAARLVAVLEVALPVCAEDAGASPAMRLRRAFAAAGIGRAIPARAEAP